MSKQAEKVPSCQRCLQKGHWSFECTNSRAYVFRASATMQYLNPSLKKVVNATPPEENSPKSPPHSPPKPKRKSPKSPSKHSHSSSSSSSQRSRSRSSSSSGSSYSSCSSCSYSSSSSSSRHK